MVEIVCLHSSQSSGAQWRALKQQLSELLSDARIHTPNLIGYARDGYDAAHVATQDFRLADEIDALLALFEHIKIDANAVRNAAPQPLHLVGHSYGGAVALRMARLLCQAGTPPASVCLYEPVAFHVLPADDPARDEICAISAQMDELSTAAATSAFVNYWNQPGYFEALPTKVQQGMFAKQTKVQADFAALLNETAQLADYQVIECPVLLMQGTQSPLSSRRVANLLASVLPNCTKVEVEAGHMAPLTAPDLVNPSIAKFIHEFSARTRA